MRIDHIALWTRDLEALRSFYLTYFNGQSNQRYTNPATDFQSYFITFPDPQEGAAGQAACRLELMIRPDVTPGPGPDAASQLTPSPGVGIAHLAFSVGEPEDVEALTARLEAEGFTIASRPRWTGDGYFESAVLDPDGNLVEITN